MAEHDQASAASGGPVSDRLQALLSRAAEEQLSEQRQLSAGLADLRALLTRLEEQLRSQTPPGSRDEPVVDLVSLADALAPRVADLLLERLREVADEAERRIVEHVDEAVLALAQALLRPRGRATTSGAAGPERTPDEP